MIVLSGNDVRAALPMPAAIEAAREAFLAHHQKRCVQPERIHLDAGDGNISLTMPSLVQAGSGGKGTLAVKIVNVFPSNRERNLPPINAAVLVFDALTGKPEALVDGTSLTALRTAAASALATDLLAREDSSALAVFGAGTQARSHIGAMLAVRQINVVRVYSRTRARADELVRELRTANPEPDMTVAESPADAMRGADIVCCTTTSTTPVFDPEHVEEGTHINAVGSFTRQRAEVPAATVAASYVVVDCLEAALAEAGDLIQPLEAGLITREHIATELGAVVSGDRPVRTDARQLTLFKSVGMAVQDATAARAAVEQARELGLGMKLDV